MTKPKSPSIKVTGLSDDDMAWIKAQSEALGFDDDALMIRMLIRDARKKGVSFAMVATGPETQPPHVAYQRPFIREVRLESGAKAWAAAPFNDPPQDFEFTQPNDPAAFDQSAEPQPDDLSETLSDSVIDAMIAQAGEPEPTADIVALPQPSASYRAHRASMRSSTHLRPVRSTHQPAPFDGPGSRTQAAGGSFLHEADERMLTPLQKVQRNAFRHFG